MRFGLTIAILASAPLLLAAGLAAQSDTSTSEEQQALRSAKANANAAERRSELLRQEASSAENAADKIVAQRAMLSAEIDAAAAQMSAANARLTIIASRQKEQRAKLGIESEPMLRLNAALQAITAKPTALLIAQPGQRIDYIHLRAVMATVQPEIARKTAFLRRQIKQQNELRAQEMLAIKSLQKARASLNTRRTELARLEKDARGRAGDLSADAAVEFEQSIAQGERARDLVERIDTIRTGTEKSGSLAALDGPVMRSGSATRVDGDKPAYIIPGHGDLIFGFNELNSTGYRERGIRLAFEPSATIAAPAAGKVTFAGAYRSYGDIIIIEHGGGWTSLLTNLGDIDVAVGQKVTQGQALGNARAEDPEITLELRRNGRIMDIAAMLD